MGKSGFPKWFNNVVSHRKYLMNYLCWWCLWKGCVFMWEMAAPYLFSWNWKKRQYWV